MSAQIAVPYDEIATFCLRHRVRKLSLFGSVLRDDFRKDSDVDVLVDFETEAYYTFADLMQMEAELEAILGRKVDLGEEQSVANDPNYIRRKAILNSAQVIYEK